MFGKLNSPDTVRIALLSFLLFSADVFATGLMSCESEPREAWQSKEDLRAWLNDDGWQVRKIKVDGGCYEVYGTTPDGQRVEAYFHPISFEKLLVTRRGEILFESQIDKACHPNQN